MQQWKAAILGSALAMASFAAMALEENRFAVEPAGAACMLAVLPHREALDISFKAPDLLVVQTTYELIPGSGAKLKLSDGSELLLGSEPGSNRRQMSLRVPADKIEALLATKRVTVYTESARGPLFRRVGMKEFAQAYADFKGCAPRS